MDELGGNRHLNVSGGDGGGDGDLDVDVPGGDGDGDGDLQVDIPSRDGGGLKDNVIVEANIHVQWNPALWTPLKSRHLR